MERGGGPDLALASPPEARWQDIGDASVQYLFYDGHGPTVVLLHATGFMPWLWHPLAKALSGTFRLVAPYFCDHREIDLQRGAVSWIQLARDLIALCDGLKIDRPLFVGHSMGATVVTIAEATWGPRAAGMLLIEPIFLPQEIYRITLSLEQHPLASKAAKRRNSWSDEDEARAYLTSKTLFRHWDSEMLDLYIRHGMQTTAGGGMELTCPPPREAALFMGGTDCDPWPMLPRLACPVMILEGERSENASLIDLRKAARAIPRGSHRLVANAGHLIPMEQPQQTVQAIRDFAATIAWR
jgi:pimeloyl-ACP methyl ester carboxylesterase